MYVLVYGVAFTLPNFPFYKIRIHEIRIKRYVKLGFPIGI